MDTQDWDWHLRVKDTDRGLVVFPEIDGIDGQSVIFESSLATEPAIWLVVKDSSGNEASIQLGSDHGWRLASQIQHAFRSHYQGHSVPEWVGD